jgi:hypothetical protein
MGTTFTYSMFNNNGTKSAKDLSGKFKQIPNANMRGTTFDVRHLDKFIQSGAGQIGAVKPTAAYSVRRLSINNSTVTGGNQKVMGRDDVTGANHGSALSTIQPTANDPNQFVSINGRDETVESDNKIG